MSTLPYGHFTIGKNFWNTLLLDHGHDAGRQTGLFSSHTSYNFYVRTACLICLPVCLAVLRLSVRLFISEPVLPFIVSGSVATCQDRTWSLCPAAPSQGFCEGDRGGLQLVQ